MNRVTSSLRHILGFTPCPVSDKSTKEPKRRRPYFLLEQLESRDLLAGLLPAPESALAQHPADNPTLPAAFDVFNPPVASVATTAK